MWEAELVLAEALLVVAAMVVGGIVAGLLRWRSHRNVQALANEPAPQALRCVIEGDIGCRLLDQVQSLIAQLEPAARSGSSALVGTAGEGGVGDSIQRALEECARDWARSISTADEPTSASLVSLGLTAQGAQDVADRIAVRERPQYRAALTYFQAAERRLTADATLGLYR